MAGKVRLNRKCTHEESTRKKKTKKKEKHLLPHLGFSFSAFYICTSNNQPRAHKSRAQSTAATTTRRASRRYRKTSSNIPVSLPLYSPHPLPTPPTTPTLYTHAPQNDTVCLLFEVLWLLSMTVGLAYLIHTLLLLFYNSKIGIWKRDVHASSPVRLLRAQVSTTSTRSKIHAKLFITQHKLSFD